jgi:hypothetical protein
MNDQLILKLSTNTSNSRVGHAGRRCAPTEVRNGRKRFKEQRWR